MQYEDQSANDLRNIIRKKHKLPIKTSSFFDFLTPMADRDESELQTGEQWRLDILDSDLDPVKLTYYGCPVCKRVYGSKESALNCSKQEKEFQDLCRNIKIGDVIKLVRRPDVAHDIVDLFSFKDTVPNHHFVHVMHFDYGFNGHYCGKLFTIFVDYNFEPVELSPADLNPYPFINAEILDKFTIEISSIEAWRDVNTY